MSDSSDDDDEAPEAVAIPPPPAPAPPATGAPVPVTMITGFLGAGKTTLVNYILTASHGYRIAVLINEFGASRGIESAMVQEADGGADSVGAEEWVEVANGCLCCSVKDDFVQALENLMERRHKFDYILLETTGLANPGPVAGVLWVDDQLEAKVGLDSIVTVVDGCNLRRQLGEDKEEGTVNEAALQIAYADTILLNKVDLLDPSDAGALEREVRSINAHAAIIKTERCHVDLGAILDRGTFGPARLEKVAADVRAGAHGGGGAEGAHEHEGHECGESCSHHTHDAGDGHTHDTRVGTISFEVAGDVELEGVNTWLDGVLWEHAVAADVYRMKGLLSVAGSSRKHVLQSVHEMYEVLPGAEWGAGEPRGSRIVAIGRSLSKAALEESFLSAQKKARVVVASSPA